MLDDSEGEEDPSDAPLSEDSLSTASTDRSWHSNMSEEEESEHEDEDEPEAEPDNNHTDQHSALPMSQ